jgi:hypothetical protein
VDVVIRIGVHIGLGIREAALSTRSRLRAAPGPLRAKLWIPYPIGLLPRAAKSTFIRAPEDFGIMSILALCSLEIAGQISGHGGSYWIRHPPCQGPMFPHVRITSPNDDEGL